MRIVLAMMVLTRLPTWADWGTEDEVITARRALISCSKPLVSLSMLDLHKFMVAISRIEVNHDGQGMHCPTHR